MNPLIFNENESENKLDSKIKKIKREAIEKVFFDKLEQIKESSFSVINYHGLGGIGKTTIKDSLLSQINIHPYICSVSLDMKQNNSPISVNDFYIELEKTLRKKVPLYYFTLAYSIYFKKINPKVTMKNSKISFAEEGTLLAEIFDQITLNRSIAIAQVVYKYSSKKYFKNKAYIKELEELEEKDKYEIEDELGKFLFYDIQELINDSVKNDIRFIFFFDTYEVLKLDKKLENVVRKFISYSKGKNSLFVTFGRDKFQENEESKRFVTQVNVESFSKEDAIKILEINGVSEKEIIDVIVKNSSGVAIYLMASIRIYKKMKEHGECLVASSFNDIDSRIIERLLCYASKSEIESYRALAIAGRFNHELFCFIKKEFNIQESFDDILSNDFIEKKLEDFFAFHALLQNSIMATTTEIEKEFIHKKFYVYFKSLATDELNLSNYSYIDLLQNTFYHGLQINNEDSFFKWFSEYEEKLRFYNLQRELIPLLTNTMLPLVKQEQYLIKVKFILLRMYIELNELDLAKELSEDIINRNLLEKEHELKYKFFQGLILHKSGHNKEQTFKYLDYVLKNSSDNLMKLDVLWKLVTLFKHKHLKSEYFNKILKLMDNSDNQLSYIAHYRKIAKYYIDEMNEYDLAEEKLNKALKLAEEYLDNKHKEIADIYYAYSALYLKKDLAFKDKAFEKLYKALVIYEEIYTSNHTDISKCYNSLIQNFYFIMA